MIYQKILTKGIFTVNYISNNDENITVFCPGLAWSKIAPYFLFSKTAKSLYEIGYNAVLFDYYGQGDSTGDYEDVSFDAVFNSLREVIDDLKIRGYVKINLIGIGIGNLLIDLLLNDPKVHTAVFIDYDVDVFENMEKYSELFDNINVNGKFIFDEINESVKGKILRALIGVTPWYRGYPINLSVFKIPQNLKTYKSLIKKPIYEISKSTLHDLASCLDSLLWVDWVDCKEWPNALDTLVDSITNWIVKNYKTNSKIKPIETNANIYSCEQALFDIDDVQAILHIPNDNKASDSCVIYEPGIGGDRVDHMRCGVMLSRIAQKNGFYSLRYDYPGMGITPGELYKYKISEKINLLKKFINYITEHYNVKNYYIVSFSEGAKIASWMCTKEKHVKSSVMWSPILTSEIINYYEPLSDKHFLPRFVKHPKYGIVLPIQGYHLGLSYFDDHKQYDFYSYVKNSEVPMKIIFGDNDPFFDKEFFKDTSNPLITLMEIENDGHLFNYKNMMTIILKTIEHFSSLRKEGNICE